MAYNDEQVKIIKEFFPKIKKELGIKWCVRFKTLAYYFPEIIEKKRLTKFIEYAIMGNFVGILLTSYMNEHKYYGTRIGECIKYHGLQPILYVENFFEKFCI